MTAILLHGFWGQPADWSDVIRLLPLHARVVAPDLYEPGPLAPHHTLAEWVDHFLEWSAERGERPTLVGYSMGARLALSAVARAPERFGRVLLLSANPGVPATDAPERERWELAWRERFLTQPWAELERSWQGQEVFAGDRPVAARRRGEVLREMLGQSLVHWSPRFHAFSATDLKALPARVDWAFGALDQKYLNTAKSLQELPVQGQINVIQNAGHRIPMDAPRFVADWLGPDDA